MSLATIQGRDESKLKSGHMQVPDNLSFWRRPYRIKEGSGHQLVCQFQHPSPGQYPSK